MEKNPIKCPEPNTFSPELKAVVESMLRFHEKDRPEWESLFKHSLF
jgi:hypothetical protein